VESYQQKIESERRKNIFYLWKDKKTRISACSLILSFSSVYKSNFFLFFMISKKAFSLFLQAPTDSKYWIFIPLLYTLFLQLLTGIPKPDLLKEFDASEIIVKFSEEIFSYPFWLQDLSHLPLFFLFTWAWFWHLGLKDRLWRSSALHISLFYACFNELSQALIPQRFPSIGDLAMNILGVVSGVSLFCILKSRSEKKA